LIIGYLEDRRPASNMDPYVVTSLLAETTLLWEPTLEAEALAAQKLSLKVWIYWLMALWMEPVVCKELESSCTFLLHHYLFGPKRLPCPVTLVVIWNSHRISEVWLVLFASGQKISFMLGHILCPLLISSPTNNWAFFFGQENNWVCIAQKCRHSIFLTLQLFLWRGDLA